MAAALSLRSQNLGTLVVEDTSATSTRQANVFGAAATLFAVQIDNTLNTSAAVYFKLWNHNSPTVGTTAPNMVIFCAGGVKRQVTIDAGVRFGTGVSYACTTAAADSASASPSNAVPIALLGTR